MVRPTLLLSRARRASTAAFHQTPRLHALLRPFSSSITPVSYAPKPKDPEPPSPPPQRPRDEPQWPRGPEGAAPDGSRAWSREDLRFIKDGAGIAPVSYSARVAPLPEDRPAEPVVDEAMRREEERIRSNARVRSFLNPQVEEDIPFPTLIKMEKKPSRTSRVMDLSEAIRQVQAHANEVKRKFVETVEAHVNLGVDPRRGDQMVRGALTLPHGTGKTVRVAVFAEGPSAEEARAAGADVVGGDELIEEIKNGGGKLNFDKCIATPAFMPRLSKIARILGPRGLMPNPKLGSVTSDIAGAVKQSKCGRIDFKIDKTAIVHVGLGKVTFSEESLRENIGAFVNALLVAKPVGLKKTSKYAGYVKNFTLSSTMGPGFPVSITSLSVAADNYNKIHGK